MITTKLLKSATDRLDNEVAALLKDGFVPYFLWSEPAKEGDEIRSFGFMALIKRKKPE